MGLILRLIPWILIVATGNGQLAAPMDHGGIPSDTVSLGSLLREPIDANAMSKDSLGTDGQLVSQSDVTGRSSDHTNLGAPRIPINLGGVFRDTGNTAEGRRTLIDFDGIPTDSVNPAMLPRVPNDAGSIPPGNGGTRTHIDINGPISQEMSNPTSNGAKLPPCPGVMCTLEFIPETCRQYQTQTTNGTPCRGCPQWIPGCREMSQEVNNGNGQTPTQTPTIPPTTACPLLACENINIPPNCGYIETYDYHGRTCQWCPVWRPDCTAPNSNSDVACPILDCIQIHIQPDCKESTFFEFNGRKCEGCPKWRPGCTPSFVPDNSLIPGGVPPVSCPMLRCPERIPTQCQVQNSAQIGGQTCALCPTWNERCQSNRNADGRPSITCPLLQCQEIIPPQCQLKQTRQISGQTCSACPTWKAECLSGHVACPMMACQGHRIPVECQEQTPYIYRGKQCFGCPKWRLGCVGNNGQMGNNQLPDFNNWITERNNVQSVGVCPLVNCQPINAPGHCIQQDYYNVGGRQCLKCPTIDPNCQILNQPRLFADVDFRMVNSGRRVMCPTVACPAIYIPPECHQDAPYEFQGQTCYGCPELKPGCQVNGNRVEAAAVTNMAADLMHNVSCPSMACPFVLIPAGCREEQIYDFHGKTCTACPKWRDGCRAEMGNPEVTCPPVTCQKIYIPPQCKEEVSFFFKGQTCFKCPIWRQGCTISHMGKPVDPNEITAGNKPPRGPGGAVCPVIGCTGKPIPSECREEQPYEFNGRTCYGCPKWRQNCMTGQGPQFSNNACPSLKCRAIATECIEETTYTVQGKTCVGCPKYRDECVAGQTPHITDVACPTVGCPVIAISPECTEETTYEFQGKLCPGCPKVKSWCVHGQGQTLPDTTCPVMKCTLIYIPPNCKDEQPYDFNGKLCYNCPQWKANCTNGHGAIQPHLPVSTTCPKLNCDVRIPDDCIEEQFYQFQGQRCQQCPAWRNGCVPKIPVSLVNGRGNEHNTPAIGCPLMRCNKMYIPDECKDTPSYDYNGKTCSQCPIWRDGCVPSDTSHTGSGNQVYTGNELINKPVWFREQIVNRFAGIRNTWVPVAQTTGSVACPELPCNKGIPVHCQLATTYNYKSKICPGCPLYNARCQRNSPLMNGLMAFRMFNELML